ncbi:MAG: AraC family transcriptional regulator [Tagaea sp.]|nr:AraC family transcriptional regulator [Tagaea sp.]
MNRNSRFLDPPGMRIVMSDGSRRGPAHAHAWPTAKILIDGPENRWRIGSGEVTLAPGQATLMNAFEMHEGLDREPCADRRLLVVLMSPEAIEALTPPGAPAPAPERPFVSGKVDLPAPCRLAAASLASMLADRRPKETPAPELGQALASALISCFAVPAGSLKSPPLDFRLRHPIERARAAPEFLSVDDMVAISGLSRSRFFELFTAGMGLPPQAFLDALLLHRALDELPRGRKPVAELGRELGFAVPDTFTRFVSREVGLTPRAFRKVASGTSA